MSAIYTEWFRTRNMRTGKNFIGLFQALRAMSKPESEIDLHICAISRNSMCNIQVPAPEVDIFVLRFISPRKSLILIICKH